MQPHKAARKTSFAKKSKKSPSPARNLPGNMRISFRRSPTPLREVLHYKPRDAAEEVRAPQDQQGRAVAPRTLALLAEQAPTASDMGVDGSVTQPRQVSLAKGKGRIRTNFIPWNSYQKGRQAGKGKGKSKGKQKKGKGKNK